MVVKTSWNPEKNMVLSLMNGGIIFLDLTGESFFGIIHRGVATVAYTKPQHSHVDIPLLYLIQLPKLWWTSGYWVYTESLSPTISNHFHCVLTDQNGNCGKWIPTTISFNAFLGLTIERIFYVEYWIVYSIIWLCFYIKGFDIENTESFFLIPDLCFPSWNTLWIIATYSMSSFGPHKRDDFFGGESYLSSWGSLRFVTSMTCWSLYKAIKMPKVGKYKKWETWHCVVNIIELPSWKHV